MEIWQIIGLVVVGFAILKAGQFIEGMNDKLDEIIALLHDKKGDN